MIAHGIAMQWSYFKWSALAQLNPLENRTVLHHRWVNSMSAFERLMVPGCTELPRMPVRERNANRKPQITPREN